jgi:predicted MFS family arabinose efflux permease
VALTNAAAFFSSFTNFNLFILLPTLAETPRGVPAEVRHLVHYGFSFSPTRAGLLMVPVSVSMLAAGPIASRLGGRLGSMKWTLAFGLAMLSALATALVLWHDRPWEIAAVSPFLGFGFGMAFASLATLITEAVPPTHTGIATGMNTVMRMTGAQTGAQVGAAVLTGVTIAGTGVPREAAFEIAFTMAALAAAIGVGTAVFITPLRRRSDMVDSAADTLDESAILVTD